MIERYHQDGNRDYSGRMGDYGGGMGDYGGIRDEKILSNEDFMTSIPGSKTYGELSQPQVRGDV